MIAKAERHVEVAPAAAVSRTDHIDVRRAEDALRELLRGFAKSGSSMVTVARRGAFKTHVALRKEVMGLLHSAAPA